MVCKPHAGTSLLMSTIDGAVHHFMLSGRKLENPPSEPDLEIEPLI